MITSAFVKIWGRRVGALAWNPETGLGAFEFDEAFRKMQWDLAPVKMSIYEARNRIFTFPGHRNSSAFKGLPGLLADVLPDKYGNALINTWLAEQGRPSDSLNPVEILCFIGQRGMGALEFEPAILKTPGRPAKIEISSLVDIAEKIMGGRKNFLAKPDAGDEKALAEILKIGTSAGGARAKALIAYNTKTNEVRSGQADAPKGFSHWIIKFDGVADQQSGISGGYGRVEMAYYLMAREAGIEMTESRLLEENGRAHFITRRFDRTGKNEKLHVQSFCALQHYDFNEITLYSYEQLFETMRMLGLPYPQAEQLYRRMVFNVMARNCDDRTKNFSFLMDQSGQWKLSPAFDVCHAYRPGSAWVSQQSLSVNGKRKNISREDFLMVAGQMNVKKAESIITHISGIISQWKLYAKQTGVTPKLRDAIQKTIVNR